MMTGTPVTTFLQWRASRWIALCMTLLVGATLGGPAAGGDYRIASNRDEQLCAAVGSALNAQATPANLCEWRFRPQAAAAHLSTPEWTPLTISRHENYVQQMRTVVPAYYRKLTAAQLAELWREKFEKRWRDDMSKGVFEYFSADFDLDNDGNAERVLMEERADCSLQWPSPPAPKLYVIDRETDQLDIRYGVWGANVLNAFAYRGKTMLAYLEPLPVDAQVVAGRRVHRDADGGEQWFPEGDVPVAVVRIFEPARPGINNPFLYRKQVCSFNVHG